MNKKVIKEFIDELVECTKGESNCCESCDHKHNYPRFEIGDTVLWFFSEQEEGGIGIIDSIRIKLYENGKCPGDYYFDYYVTCEGKTVFVSDGEDFIKLLKTNEKPKTT